jgi:serine/threonine-protein kinase
MTAPQFPRMFGKYALLRPFARGGMGEICLAASGELGGAEKLCLIKKVPEDRESPGLTARLLDEAKVAVRLNHTNLVTVFDAGTADGELYIAMELIEGRDLRAVWNRTAECRSRIPVDVALFVARELARGLDYAHNYGGLGLVHRDIAPPNVLISWHGEVKITDFGLARSILKNEKTAPGIVYGRIAYLAPEQARGEQADARTDVFATGVILWELLTGRPLHETTDQAVKNLEMARHPRIEAPSHFNRGLPSSIDVVALKALAPDREQRYRTAEELRKALAEELGRLAPTTDSTRVASFLGELFPDEIKREASEHERMLREDLPKLRARATFQVPILPPKAAPPKTPQRGLPVDPRSPDALPGVRWEASGEFDAIAPQPVTSKARRPTLQPLDRGSAKAAPAGEEEEERTSVAPPRGIGAMARGLAARPKPEPIPDIDPEELEQPHDLVGEIIDGRYRVARLLGTGGMGAVYEAEHIEIGKKVALKVLHPRFSRQADLVARFRREARAASKVGHPNIVDVTDSGTTEAGDVYFVMERLDGLDLGEVLRQERRVAPDRTMAIGTQICRALQAAHAAGIIHRDLKPENIFLVSRDGNADFVKVLDFGIAKSEPTTASAAPRRLTTPGIAMGTPEYMAPEQAAGKAVDGRVDIYSVGAILYEMLTGEPPHAGANVMDILAKKATELPAPIRPRNPGVPELLEQVVMSCLEREPERRPQTMSALEYELTKCMKGRGSAVAAVLGIKTGPEESAFPDEGSRPHNLFEPGTGGGRGTFPSLPVMGTGGLTPPTGASPIEMGPEGRVRIAESKINSREAIASTVALDERDNAELRSVRLRARLSPVIGAIGGIAFLIGGGYFAYRYTHRAGSSAASSGSAIPSPTPGAHLPEPEIAPPAAELNPTAAKLNPTAAKGDPEDRMSEAEVARMLEWARRTVEGGRIIAPPGDNLKELLDRIEKASPANAQAEALRQRTAAVLGRRGVLALKKGRLDEAEDDFKAVVVLKPDDDWSRGRLARTLQVRAERSLERRRFAAALADANQALEIQPEDAAARLVLADTYLAMGKREIAGEEYKRVLDLRPGDKHAQRGLKEATESRPALKPKKKKR